MARWRPEVSEVLPSDAGEDLCQFCGGLSLRGSESASLRVVVDASGGLDRFRASPEGELLQKIFEAMALDPARVGYVFLEPSEEEGCSFERMRESGTRFLLAFGADALSAVTGAEDSIRGKVYDCRGIPVLGTESLRNLVEHPSLKRAAWEEIKIVIRELGLK